MELTELLKELVEHNKTEKGYQIHLNSGNLDNNSSKHTDVEFGDLYFSECRALKESPFLCFGNVNRKPVSQSEDGTDIYPLETNSNMFIDLSKIEKIEDVEDFQDWFVFPSERVINIYMFPEDKSLTGNRNIVAVGFMS